MKKRVFGRYLSRGEGARRALYVSLARALVERGKIETSKAKAKAVIPEIEKLVTQGLKGNWSKILSFFGNDRKITRELSDLVRQFNRKSGFIRLINLSKRTGDQAAMVRIEWVDKIVTEAKEPGDKKKLEVKTKAKGETRPRKTAKRKVAKQLK